MDLVCHPGRVDHHAGVLADRDAGDRDLAGGAVDRDIGDPGGPGGADTRPAAMDIARLGEAAPAQDIAVLLHARADMWLPVRPLGGGPRQLGGALVIDVAQAECDGIDPGLMRELVDIALMGEDIRHRRDAAQPGRAHDRRHVIGRQSHVLVIVGRHRGAIAHPQRRRLVGDAPGQQQRQGRGGVGRVPGVEVIGFQRAARPEPALDVDQLGRALRLPQMLLFARELDPHRRADRTRQQHGVGDDIVGAVAAIAAGGLEADDVDPLLRQAGEQGKVVLQRIGVLAAGPDGDAVRAHIGDGAGRADRAVHMVGPDVRSVEPCLQAFQRGFDIALLGQKPRRRGMGAQGLTEIGKIGRRELAPVRLELQRSFRRLLFALGNDANEIALHHHGADAGHVGDRVAIDSDQALADEIAGIHAGIGRAHHPAMQHARHADIVDIGEAAGDLGGDVDARDRAADELVLVDLLELGALGQRQQDALVGEQCVEGDRRRGLALARDHAVAERDLVLATAERGRSQRDQSRPDLRRRDPYRERGDLDRLAGDGRALVGRVGGVAEHHLDRVEGEIELFRHHLGERGADAGAEIDMAVEGEDATLRRQADMQIEPVFGRCVGGCALAWRDNADHAGALQQRLAGERFAHGAAHQGSQEAGRNRALPSPPLWGRAGEGGRQP